METQELDKQVMIIQNSVEIFKTAPEILKSNQQRSQKAVIVGTRLLSDWEMAMQIVDENERMTALAAIDERSNKFLVNCGAALKEEKELRAAITQLMDEFKKMFTSAENEIDKTKSGTVADKVQGRRNEYAKQAYQVAERKRMELEREAAKDKEEIEIRSYVEKWVSDKLISLLSAKKLSLTNAFNSITLEDFETRSAALRNLKTTNDSLQSLIGTTINIPFHSYHESAEIEAIQNATIQAYPWEGFALQWDSEITIVKNDLIDKLPSKLTELQEAKRMADELVAEKERQRIAEEQRKKELAEANAAEKVKLEEKQRLEREEEQTRNEQLRKEQEAAAEEQKKREQAEADKLAMEEAEAKAKADQEAELKKQGDHTMAMFDKEAAIAENIQAPEARQGFEIEILHPAAWVQIFQLWFENQGKNMAIDKIGTTKMDQMKSWAEKHAHKEEVMIESKFLKYVPSFKAVNRKAS